MGQSIPCHNIQSVIGSLFYFCFKTRFYITQTLAIIGQEFTLVLTGAFKDETGLYRPEAELSVYGSNEDLLRQVAAFTGGRFASSARSVFDSDGRSIPVVWQLWPWLLALAMGLSVAELVLRKQRRA